MFSSKPGCVGEPKERKKKKTKLLFQENQNSVTRLEVKTRGSPREQSQGKSEKSPYRKA